MKISVVLIAGLQNGRLIARYLKNNKNIALKKVYVLKDKYSLNISDFAFFDDLFNKNTLEKISKINDYANEIESLSPDVIIVVGWSQILCEKIINSARIATIGFHPSELPKDRGRSVLAWQLSEGYEFGAVSMFCIDKGIDSGPIIAQEKFKIFPDDTIRNVLDKVYTICLNLTRTYLPLFIDGVICPIEQQAKLATYRRLRIKEDALITWNRRSRELYNLIRAVTLPYPCAYTLYNELEILIISAKLYDVDSCYDNIVPGTVLEIKLYQGVVVKTGDSALLIKEMSLREGVSNINLYRIIAVGEKFHSNEYE